MENFTLCLSDCNKALDLDPNFTKVFRRKALSQIQLLQFDDAIFNIESGLKVDSKDENLLKDLQDCKKVKKGSTLKMML